VVLDTAAASIHSNERTTTQPTTQSSDTSAISSELSPALYLVSGEVS
jgi:hypothetical protein